MSDAPKVRADALHFVREIDQAIKSELDDRRRAFLRFVYAQSLVAVTELDSDASLDMRAVTALAHRMFDRQTVLAEILAGKNLSEDW